LQEGKPPESLSPRGSSLPLCRGSFLGGWTTSHCVLLSLGEGRLGSVGRERDDKWLAVGFPSI